MIKTTHTEKELSRLFTDVYLDLFDGEISIKEASELLDLFYTIPLSFIKQFGLFANLKKDAYYGMVVLRSQTSAKPLIKKGLAEMFVKEKKKECSKPKLKYVFLDFDDTLVLHKAQKENYLQYLEDIKTLPANELYATSFVPEAMKSFVKYCQEHNYKMICITHIADKREINKKIEYIQYVFEEIFLEKIVGTASAEQKIAYMKRFSKEAGIPADQILLVDDKLETIVSAKKAGFKVMKPMEILCTNGDDKKIHDIISEL